MTTLTSRESTCPSAHLKQNQVPGLVWKRPEPRKSREFLTYSVFLD